MSNQNNTVDFKVPNLKAQGGLKYIAGLFFVFVVVMSSVVVVDAGKVGVVKKLGAVQEEALNEGVHFKVPFIDTIIQVNTRLNSTKSAALSSSKDLQTVKTEVSVQYSIKGAAAPLTYQKIGLIGQIESSVIEPAIEESVKSVTAKYTAEELITKREKVKTQIQIAIQDFMDTTLNNKGIQNGVKIANVAITDFNFSPEFNRAIELKVKAEQEALQAKNEKIRRVTQAEAAAAEEKLAADASAYAITAASKARAEAIRREAKSLKSNPELIQLRIAEKWDGQLPKFNGSSAVPFLNIDSINTKK
ncbi:prohibitin family protein [bacterium]|jgi:prohibitin 2|nr:prohibitin family protein [bacterium]